MTDPRLTRRAALAALAGAAGLPRPAQAQPAWPERPIRWVVPFPPAGTADILSRLMAERLAPRLPQPVVVENRAGAGGTLAADIIAKARGDAHAVMVSNFAPHGVSPALFPNVPYDADRDFTHMTLIGALPMVLAVNPNQPYRTLPEFIAAARARPGGLRYAYGGNGTASHLIGLLLWRAAGVEVTGVPYRGAGPALADVLGGQVEAILETLPAAIGHLRAERLRPLAVSSPARAAALPAVPNFTELGLGDATGTNWFGFSGPAGMPDWLVQRWLAELRAVVAMPETGERLAQLGLEPVMSQPAEYTAFVRAELARWRRVVTEMNVRPD
ncbi:MAG: tripartite tricarboxylate transporter substrate binding protein [Acetobacteraceae bacterium]|nr:tripartite tricarboxylate transporter substrate binding protein [Acetobacteraceae bacterium]